MFITFSGIDGSGKTTASKALAKALSSRGYDVLWTYEPGDSALGKAMRAILLDRNKIYRSAEAELMLFMADRAEHIETVIKPHIKKGGIVVCDRYIESSLAYQAPKLGADGQYIIYRLHETMNWPYADINILMDIDPEIAAARIIARGSSESDPDITQLKALRAVYQHYDGDTHRIDAAQTQDEILTEILYWVYASGELPKTRTYVAMEKTYAMTFAMIKSGAMQRQSDKAIIQMAIAAGLHIEHMEVRQLTPQEAGEFYAEHAGRPYFDGLVASVSDSPVTLLVLSGNDAIGTWRKLLGATNPAVAEEGSIRKLYGVGLPDNAAHGSDSPESAAREIGFFVKDAHSTR